MNLETKQYFDTTTDDLKAHFQKSIQLPDLLQADVNLEQSIRKIAKEVAYKLKCTIPKITVEPLKILQEKSKLLSANSQIRTIIENYNTTNATKATAAVLERDKPIPPESFKDAVEAIASQVVRKTLKENKKRLQKNCLGGRKDQPSNPKSNGHASKRNSKRNTNSPLKKTQPQKGKMKKKVEEKLDVKTKRKRENANHGESKQGKQKKQKKN